MDDKFFTLAKLNACCIMVQITKRRYVLLSLPDGITVPSIRAERYAIFMSNLLFGPASYDDCYVWLAEHARPMPKENVRPCCQCGVDKTPGIRCSVCNFLENCNL